MSIKKLLEIKFFVTCPLPTTRAYIFIVLLFKTAKSISVLLGLLKLHTYLKIIEFYCFLEIELVLQFVDENNALSMWP